MMSVNEVAGHEGVTVEISPLEDDVTLPDQLSSSLPICCRNDATICLQFHPIAYGGRWLVPGQIFCDLGKSPGDHLIVISLFV